MKKIEKEKAQLVEAKKIKKENSLPPITGEEKSFEIPNGWAFTRLGSYIHNFGQKTPDIEFEYIDVASINNDLGIISAGLDLVQPENAPSRARKIVKKGCVIYSTVRPYLLNIACVDRHFNHEAIASTAFAVLNPVQDCSPRFLYYLLRSPYFIQYVETFMKGVAYPAINDGNLLLAPIPIPPVEEQKAIVAIVNELFAEVEQLEELTKKRIALKEDFVTSALQHLAQTDNTTAEWNFLQPHFASFFTEKANIKKLREAILQLAVQGKLTAKWRVANPNVKPASELLKRIEAEKQKLIKEKKIKKENPLPPIKEEDKPYELPGGWVWCRLGDLITFLNGYAYQSSTYVPLSNYQVIRLGNVKNDNFLINTKEAYVPESIGKNTLEYKIYVNDILTTLTGTKDKRDYCFTCIVKEEHIENRVLLLNQRVGCIRAIDKSASELLNKFLKADAILDQLFSTETGTANQGNIGSSAFKGLAFPLPPQEEQKAIIAKVNTLMALCDELEQQIDHSQHQIEQLMQSCLREAFEPNEAKIVPMFAEEPLIMVAEASSNYDKLHIKPGREYFAKQVLCGKIISIFRKDPNFTHIKLMKLQYLAEHLVQADIEWNYYRQTAGPFDPKITHDIIPVLERVEWFKERQYKFQPLIKVTEIDKYYAEYFGTVDSQLDRLFKLFKNINQDDAEIVATLYAVWNNLMIKKETVTDKAITDTFYQWSERKYRYELGYIHHWLQWMKDKDIVPTGFGQLIKEARRP